MTPPARDPRRDPVAGDVLRRGFWPFRRTRRVIGAYPEHGSIVYATSDRALDILETNYGHWRLWASGATIERTAEEREEPHHG